MTRRSTIKCRSRWDRPHHRRLPRCKSGLGNGRRQAGQDQADEDLVNTLPPLKWGSFWANPAIAKLGAQGLIPALLEDVDRGVVVPIQGHAATALDPAIPERKMLESHTATRASLGRVGRIDFGDLTTGAFSLVREMGDKVGPTRIQDALGEAAGKGPRGCWGGWQPGGLRARSDRTARRVRGRTC